MPSTPMPDLNALSLPELWAELCQSGLVRRLIELARDEDLQGRGDVTAEVTAGVTRSGAVDPGGEIVAQLVLREPGVVCGLAAGPMVCELFADKGGGATFEAVCVDGDAVAAGTVVGRLRGDRSAVVTVERTLLNLVGRLSGVSTRTAAFVREIEGTGVQILDTRKTTPGLRVLEKYAVRCGGGHCHRLGLHDAVLIKDNHVAGLDLDGFEQRVGSAAALAASMRERGHIRFVQIEVDTQDQLDRVLTFPSGVVDIILLDNFSTEQLQTSVRIGTRIGSKLRFEASGGVTLETVRAIALTGVERISVGGLTHHAVSLDVGLDVRA